MDEENKRVLYKQDRENVFKEFELLACLSCGKRFLPKEYLDTLPEYPANPEGRALVRELRAKINDLFATVGGVHMQVGKSYPYIKLTNEDYPRKQWSSVMILNCMHMSWRQITPESVQQMTGHDLHRFSWLADDQIGELPKVWNWLADEDGENTDAKLLHWTAGIPLIPQHSEVAHSDEYWRQCARMNHVTD